MTRSLAMEPAAPKTQAVTEFIYTVYENPPDYPGKFVVRRFGRANGAGERIAWAVSTSLELVRESIPRELTRISRAAEQDETLLETWL